MECEETLVQLLALRFEHPHGDLDAGGTQLGHTAPLHLGKGVDTTHHTTADTLAHDQVGTGRGLAVVGTGFETHIDGGLGQQCLILTPHGGKGIDLGMSLATAHMIALADDAAIGHNHRSHHGVGFGIQTALGRQLQAASHITLIV